MLRENFERRKAEIQEEIEEMGQAIQKMLDMVIGLLPSNNALQLEEILKQIRCIDRKVNNSEETIYHHCIQLISLEQPVASDLRFSIAVLKFIGDLERIGDHCVHIARTTLRNAQLQVRSEVPKSLIEMAKQIGQMFQRCSLAIKEIDTEIALSVIREDEALDEVHKQFIKDNAKNIHSSPDLTDSMVNFMFLSRFIERIGDHMVNVCEWLVFVQEGTRPS